MFYQGKKILVTGGASFIGSHLVDALIAQNATVTVVDDLSSGLRENLQSSIDKITFIEGDLRDSQVAIDATKEQDIVFHLANIHGGRGYIDTNPGEIVQNFVIDGNVFRYARLNGVKRVCYTSSACVYPVNLQSGNQQMCYLAEEMADPFTQGGAFADREYGWGKLMGEMSLKAHHKQYDLAGVSCRLFTVYGPRENESHAIIALIAKALIKQNPYEIWGTGQQGRNFTYVSDIVTGLLLATEKITDCRAINLGTDQLVTIADAAAEVLELLDYQPEKIYYDPSKPEGVRTRVASIENQKQWLDWTPQVSFTEGLQKTIHWYRQHVDIEALKTNFEKRLFERKVR